MRYYSTCILAIVASLSLSACTTILTNLPGVYTVDVQQGNMIDQDMVNQLRPNMTKRQVLYIMGSPMLTDYFHQNRWDFIYSTQLNGGERQQKRISLFFENDQVVGIQGDFRPGETPATKPSAETTIDVPKRDLEKTLWETIIGWFGYDGVIDESPKTEKTPKAPETSSDKL
jgi:outer membrane protein assembly factor BamE